MGASILCIEKSRPHVPYERAIMAMRFNEYMIGTQFHPEADAAGMSIHLQTEEKRNRSTFKLKPFLIFFAHFFGGVAPHRDDPAPLPTLRVEKK